MLIETCGYDELEKGMIYRKYEGRDMLILRIVAGVIKFDWA